MTQPNAAPVAQGYDLVVIGSSAGGIEALSTLVASLPPNFAAALVIAQHLDPDYVSHLGDILARRTSLAVHTVVAQEPLLPGVIYVVPADRDVEITDHEVAVRPHGETRSTPSVNRLFSSAAQAHGERLIGVILTGTGSDGASGARDVKAAGGTVIIENPATAAYASMPQSLAPSTVDLVVDLPQIGPLLGDLVAGTYLPSATEADTALPALLDQVRDRTGIDFSTYKSPTILRRLQRRMALTHQDTLTAYQHYIADHPEEYGQLTASFLIKVTEFFRDPEFFAALRDEILPALVVQARAESRSLRLWSAGCATGEEAYSLAILLADLLGEDLDQVPVRIFATDVDADAIAFARRGVYPAAALATLPTAVVARAFTPVDGAYEITPALRNLVAFGQHDLGTRASFPHMDLVLCRNVLIYSPPTSNGGRYTSSPLPYAMVAISAWGKPRRRRRLRAILRRWCQRSNSIGARARGWWPSRHPGCCPSRLSVRPGPARVRSRSSLPLPCGLDMGRPPATRWAPYCCTRRWG